MVKNNSLVQKTLLVRWSLKKSGKDIKFLVGQCLVCNKRKTLTLSDNTKQAEGVGDFSKSLGEKRLNVTKKKTNKVLKNPGRTLEIGANVGTALASRNPKAASPWAPEVTKIDHRGRGLYLWKFGNFMIIKWNKEKTDFNRQHH